MSAGRPLISFRRIGKERTDQGLVLTVFCPSRTAVVPISDCRACNHCHGLSVDIGEGDSFLRCNYSAPPRVLAQADQAAPADGEPSVGDLMTTPVRCVTKDTAGDKVLRILIEDGISAVPVINGEGRPVGIVSKSDLLREPVRAGLPEGLESWNHDDASDFELDPAPLADLTAAELMTPFAFSLPINAPVSLASALMSYEAVHRLVVTEPEGMVVGIISSLDVMRWLASSRGYTIPPRSRRERI